ncbi:NAD(+) diphosphatase [Balneatrix alpica]|uniref:NAD(+) diphosphatase n=1 Tax=Balneatrix alpica TaxID=75684 RepID=UPI0027391987|nr:NAD(+) diphosphatase [Balneatrix alpica]
MFNPLTQPLCYAGLRLDRLSAQRKDRPWLEQQLQQPNSRLVPLWQGRNLLHPERPEALHFSRAEADFLLEHSQEILFLGQQQHAWFALDLSHLSEQHVQQLLPQGQFTDIRKVGPLLPAEEAAILACARGLLHWHQQHQFCSLCGHPSRADQGGHLRRCSNSACGKEHFPRLDPAVIMLVEHIPSDGGPRLALLGRSPHFPPGTYSTLAGFVETGESLEEAVAREVWEEAGVRLSRADYRASQPWPFPASIMLGFRGLAASLAIQVDQDELEDARWFSAEQLQGFGEWGDPNSAYSLPRKDSISRWLIDEWIAENLPR